MTQKSLSDKYSKLKIEFENSVQSGAILFPAVFLLFSFFLILSQQGFLSDSEIWAVAVSRQLENSSSFNSSLYTKILFHLPIYTLYSFGGDNASLLLNARLLFAAVGLLIVFMTGYLGWVIWRDRLQVWLSIFLLLSCTLFLTQGYRIRADLISTVMNLGFLLIFMRISANTKLAWPALKGVLLAFFSLLMFLATPKAAIFILAQAVLLGFWVQSSSLAERKPRARLSNSFLFTFLGVLIIGIIYLTFQGKLNKLAEAYFWATKFFLSSFEEGHDPIKHDYFFMLRRFLFMNPFLSIMIALGWVIALVQLSLRLKSAGASSASDAYRAYYVILLPLCLLHNQLTAFFIASVTPFFVIYAAQLLANGTRWLAGNFPIPQRAQLLFLAVIAVGAVCKSAYVFHINISSNTNWDQIAAVRTMDEYLTRFPQATYYDVIGILPFKNQNYLFLGPNQPEQNDKVVAELYGKEPDLFFLVEKSRFVTRRLSGLLNASYVDHGLGFWAKALVLRPRDDSKEKTKSLAFVRYQDLGLWRPKEVMGGTESLPEPCNPVKLGKLAYCSISIKSILERYEKRFHGAEIGPEETIFLKTLRNKKDTEQELPLVKFSDGQVAPLNLNDIRSQFKTAEQLLVPTSISELAFTRFPPIMLGAGIGFGRLFSYDWAF